jgi:hypothetical protein
LAAITVGTTRHIYVTGSIAGPRGDALLVAKYGSQGGLAWRRTWRHAGRLWHAAGVAIAPATDGGVYVGGYSGHGTGEGGDALLLRYSASGRLRWRLTLPTSLGTAIVVGLASAPFGVVAAVEDSGCCDVAADRDGYVQAVRADGSSSWRNPFEAPTISTATRDIASGVAIGHGGRVYVAGSIDRRVYREGSPPPDADRVIQALSPYGRVIWTRVLGRAESGWFDASNGIAIRGGTLVATGASWKGSGAGASHAWLGAFDTAGRGRWTRVWDGGKQSWAGPVAVSSWGPIYVGTGSAYRRYSRAGLLAWKRPVPAGRPSGVATLGSLYLTAAHELQRWPR